MGFSIEPNPPFLKLHLFLLAYNLGNFMRRLVLPPKVKHQIRGDEEDFSIPKDPVPPYGKFRIKLVMCLRRYPEMTREQFQDYWMNEGFRESRGMQPEYDGVAEVWFESEEDFMEVMSSPEGQQLGSALFEDERNFIDHSNSSAFIVREHEL